MRMNRDERILYDRYLMDRAILRNTVDGARDEGKYEGIKEGIQQGLQQGRDERTLEIARKMKAKGKPAIEIDLTTEEIETLRTVLQSRIPVAWD